MFMPCIKGPNMDWTVNDSLYHRFLKWKLKCENVLDCELVMLPESKKCNKVIVWSGDFGMDQYVSCCLPVKISPWVLFGWRMKIFASHRPMKLKPDLDLLTSFRQGNWSVNEWFNAVQAQVSLDKYPLETASILHRDIFCFFSEGWWVCL